MRCAASRTTRRPSSRWSPSCCMLLYVVIVPLVSRYDPNAVDFSLAYQPPSLHHPFGTDEFGRDLFLRTALGGRISIGIGFAATIAIMVDRDPLRRDLRLRRRLARQRADAIPRRALRAAVSPVRDHHAGDLRHRQLLDDGRRPDRRVVVHDRARHAWADHHAEGERLRARRARDRCALVPRSSSGISSRTPSASAIVFVFLELPNVVLGEAFLSFLGLGINPPNASWGSLAQDGYTQYLSHPDPDRDPERRDRLADPDRLLHRRRPSRRTRPADAGASGRWRCSRSTTSARTSRPAPARSTPSTASASPSSAARRSASSASRAAASR